VRRRQQEAERLTREAAAQPVAEATPVVTPSEQPQEETRNLEAVAQEAEGKDETAVQVEADSQAEQPARDEEEQTKLPS
jgi:ribonuclease E